MEKSVARMIKNIMYFLPITLSDFFVVNDCIPVYYLNSKKQDNRHLSRYINYLEEII